MTADAKTLNKKKTSSTQNQKYNQPPQRSRFDDAHDEVAHRLAQRRKAAMDKMREVLSKNRSFRRSRVLQLQRQNSLNQLVNPYPQEQKQQNQNNITNVHTSPNFSTPKLSTNEDGNLPLTHSNADSTAMNFHGYNLSDEGYDMINQADVDELLRIEQEVLQELGGHVDDVEGPGPLVRHRGPDQPETSGHGFVSAALHPISSSRGSEPGPVL